MWVGGENRWRERRRDASNFRYRGVISPVATRVVDEVMEVSIEEGRGRVDEESGGGGEEERKREEKKGSQGQFGTIL